MTRLRGIDKNTRETFGNIEDFFAERMLADIDKVENTRVANLTFEDPKYITYHGIKLTADGKATIYIQTKNQPQVLIGYEEGHDNAFDTHVQIKSGEMNIKGLPSIDNIIFACAVYNRVLSILAIVKEMDFDNPNFTEEIRNMYFDHKVVEKIDKDFIISHIPTISKALENRGGGRGSDYVVYNARRYKVRKEGRKKYILVKNESVYLGSIRGKYKPC